MKKTLGILSAALLLMAAALAVYLAGGVVVTEEMSVSEALADPEITAFLEETGELDTLRALAEPKGGTETPSAENRLQAIENELGIPAEELREMIDEYNLQTPDSQQDGTENGAVVVKRQRRGRVLDVFPASNGS